MTSKEKVIKYMYRTRKMGEWFSTFELSGKFVDGNNTGIDADTRLYEILNNDGGCFESKNFRYYIQHRSPRKDGNLTRYAQFRITKREKLPCYIKAPGDRLDFQVPLER